MSTIRQAIEHFQDCHNKLHDARQVLKALVVSILEKMEHRNAKQYEITDCSIYGDNFHITYDNRVQGCNYGDTITIPSWVIDAEDTSIALDKYLLEQKLECKRRQLQQHMNDLESLNRSIEEINKTLNET